MSIIGYPNRLRPARLAEEVIDAALGVAGVLLNADKPLPRDDDRLARIAADVTAIRQLLEDPPNDGRGHSKEVGQSAEWPSGAHVDCPTSPSQTSAAPVCPIPPGTEDAAEMPRAGCNSGAGHLNVEGIPDEYWENVR